MKSCKRLFLSMAMGVMGAFGCGHAHADNVAIHTPGGFQVLAVSDNGKWACGVFVDAVNTTFPFRWNLESGSIEMLGSKEGTALDVANDGTIAGDAPDNEVLANHAPISMPCYWRGNTRYRVQAPGGSITDGIGCGISTDGHYMVGSICKDGVYTSYIWEDGQIARDLTTGSHNVAYCVSPDGQSAAGYNTLYNRTACIWPQAGEIVYFRDSPEYSMSPWNYARKFSPDGTKLLYWGGWEVDEENDVLYLYTVYDLATGERKKVKAPSMDSDLEFNDMTDGELLVGSNHKRGYVDVAGQGMYIDEYLAMRGVNISSLIEDLYNGEDYYQGQLPIYNVIGVSADANVIVMQYYNTLGETCSLALKMEQDFTEVFPTEVKAHQLEGLNTVNLTWKRLVGANNVRGFNIYRDGRKLNMLPLNQLYYYDNNVEPGEHTYQVSAVTTAGRETRAEAMTVEVAGARVAAPFAMMARQKGLGAGYATWQAPLSNVIHKRYYDLETKDFSGFDVYEPINMEMAIRFDKNEVNAYKGHVATEVSFVPMGAHDVWAVNLYTHAADGTLQLLYSQPVAQTLATGIINTVKLDTPQALPAGDLVVAIEVTMNEGIEQVIGTEAGPVTPGYSDLLRRKTEDDFYSAYDSSINSHYTVTHLSWAIDLGLQAEGAEANTLEQYNVYVDGELAGSTTGTRFETGILAAGQHTMGVEAQYADGSKSEVVAQPLTITARYLAINDVTVEVSDDDPTEFTATWQAPVDFDATNIAYTNSSAIGQGVHGNSSTSYAFMIATDYTPAKLRGYDGYRVSAFRFMPLSDAIFTFYLTENDKLIYEYEVTETLNYRQWNSIALDKEIHINENATYRLIIDCFDPEPDTDVFALDGNMPFANLSDLVSIDNGASWMSLSTESGTIGSWMMGMTLACDEGKEVTVDGYDVLVDNKKVNSELLTETTFTHHLETTGTHTLKVNTWYPGARGAIVGANTKFNIDLTGISAVGADSNEDKAYSLQGVSVGKDFKGLVVKRGQKLILK